MPALTPYVGPHTLRDFFPFYDYGPSRPAILSWNPWTRARLWLSTVLCAPFTWTGPLPEDAEHWKPAWHGDCVTYAFLLRRVCGLLGFPEGALRVAYCEVEGKGHMVLTAETTVGCLAADCIHKTWHPWDSYGYRAWNREEVR